MLKTILLDGFKDQRRALLLGRLNLFVGRNGLGKSAFIEGLVYALSGRVPGGKSKDEVAKCFTPRGGLVRVTDEEGRWIERGINVDHAKARVSEVMKTEPEEAPTAVSIWDCNEALLDFRHFADLSSSKRRDFMLELVGAAGGKLTREKGRETLLAGFAKGLGGDGADESCILDTSKLPEGLRPVAAQWGPIWDYIESFNWPGTDASAALTFIVDNAKAKKNEARASSKQAKASLSELTVETRGAAIAAGEYEEAKRKKETADHLLNGAEAIEAAANTIKGRIEVAKENAARLEEYRSQQGVVLAERPPVAPSDGEEPESVESEEAVVKAKIDEGARLSREFSEHDERVAARENQSGQIDIYRRAFAAHQNQPMGHMMDALASFEVSVDDLHCGPELFADLKAACEEVASTWQESLVNQQIRIDAEALKLACMDRLLAETEPPSEAAMARLQSEVDILKSNIARIRGENDKWHASYLAAHEEEKGRRAIEEEITRLDERVKAAVATVASEQVRLAEYSDLPDVASYTKGRDAAAAELERLDRLKGSLDAYDGAKERAEASTAKDAAWTAFERAAVDARETYVAALAEPIKDDVGVLLGAAGRDERPYLELENARGRPVFDLGWEIADSRRSLNALSHGEAALFGAAVAVAIARRCRGRKLLLVEADRMDLETVESLLAGLVAIEDAFDAVMVSTHTLMIKPPVGWRVHEFDAGGAVTSRQIVETQAETTERLVGKIGKEAQL